MRMDEDDNDAWIDRLKRRITGEEPMPDRTRPVPLPYGLAAAFGGMAEAFERLSEHAAYLAEEARRARDRD